LCGSFKKVAVAVRVYFFGEFECLAAMCGKLMLATAGVREIFAYYLFLLHLLLYIAGKSVNT